MQGIELAHQAELDEIVHQCRWPGGPHYSALGLRAAFIVIQHADLEYQLRYYSLVDGSVKNKERPIQSFALLEDRKLIRQGKSQKYGTQSQIRHDGIWELFPNEDSEYVNERRLAIGFTVLPGFP